MWRGTSSYFVKPRVASGQFHLLSVVAPESKDSKLQEVLIIKLITCILDRILKIPLGVSLVIDRWSNRYRTENQHAEVEVGQSCVQAVDCQAR